MNREAFTVLDYSKHIGLTRPVAAKWLKRLVDKGEVEMISKARPMDGVSAKYKYISVDALED